MPVKGLVQVTTPGNQEWTPVPEDIYQVVLKDIVEKDVPVWGAKDGSMETKYLFKFVILDEGEAQGQMLTDFAAPKWFSGNTKKKFSPSRLVTIFKAIYGHYYPKLDVGDLSEPGTNQINDLIGKQVRVTVKVGGQDNNWNKITEYTKIKEEMEIPEGVKIEGVTSSPKKAAPAPAKASEPEKEEDEEEEMEEEIDRPMPWEKGAKNDDSEAQPPTD